MGKLKKYPHEDQHFTQEHNPRINFLASRIVFCIPYIKWCMDLRVLKCFFTKETTTLIGSKITFQKFVRLVSAEWIYTFKIAINGSMILLIILTLDWLKFSTRDSPDLLIKANSKNSKGSLWGNGGILSHAMVCAIWKKSYPQINITC